MAAAQTPFNTRFFTALLAGLDKSREALPHITRAAETVAARLLAGSELYIASARPDFISEGYIRSGGLMLLKEWRAELELAKPDTVLFGTTHPNADRALVQRLQQRGAHLVGPGPSLADDCEYANFFDEYIPATPPLPSEVLGPFAGEPYPLLSLHNLVLLWALTGELVAALTRRGAMPTMYQSVLVPGARQRNQARSGHHFEQQHSVPAIAPGQLATAYIDALSACLDSLLETQTAAIAQVTRAAVDTLDSGRNVHAFLISHFPILQAGAPGDPGFMQRLEHISAESPSDAELEAKLQSGDLLFFLGYYNRPATAYQVARRAGARIAEIITGTATATGPSPDYVIHPQWPFGDSLVQVPGYDIAILPSSGIVQAAIYWAVVGEMAELLK